MYFAFAAPQGCREEGKKPLLSQAFLPASFLLLFSPLNLDSQTKLGKETLLVVSEWALCSKNRYFRSILLASLSPYRTWTATVLKTSGKAAEISLNQHLQEPQSLFLTVPPHCPLSPGIPLRAMPILRHVRVHLGQCQQASFVFISLENMSLMGS